MACRPCIPVKSVWRKTDEGILSWSLCLLFFSNTNQHFIHENIKFYVTNKMFHSGTTYSEMERFLRFPAITVLQLAVCAPAPWRPKTATSLPSRNNLAEPSTDKELMPRNCMNDDKSMPWHWQWALSARQRNFLPQETIGVVRTQGVGPQGGIYYRNKLFSDLLGDQYWNRHQKPFTFINWLRISNSWKKVGKAMLL